MQNLPKKYTEVLGKVSGEETKVSKPNCFSSVQGLTQRHQTTLVSATTTPDDSTSCSNYSVMVFILVRSTTSQFLSDLYPALMIHGTCHLGAHLGQEELSGSGKATLRRDQGPPWRCFSSPLSSWVLAAVRTLFWITGFQQKLAQEVFQWVWCCHASS